MFPYTGGSNDSCDNSGNGNDGAWSGNVSSTTTSKFDRAVDLDGNDDYINFGDLAAYDFGDTQDFTIEAWVKQDVQTGTDVILSKKVDFGSTAGYSLVRWRDADGGNICLYIGDGSDTWETCTNATVATTSWTHVVAVFDQDNATNSNIYINGSAPAQTKLGTIANIGSLSNTSPVRIGATNMAPPNEGSWDGQLDNVRVYNAALTSSDITALYGNGSNRYPYATKNYSGKILLAQYSSGVSIGSASTEEVNPAPVSYWKFDEAQGSTAYDYMNVNDATLATGNSAPAWKNSSVCKISNCLFFDGTNDYVSVSNTVPNIYSISFWVNPLSTTTSILEFNSSASLSISSGNLSASGITSPAYYVNGKSSSSIQANKWQHVTMVTSSPINGNLLRMGKVSTNFMKGYIDELKFYNYERTVLQAKRDAVVLAASGGSSVVLGANKEVSLSDGLVGHWSMDENVGTTTVDTSGNNNLGTLGTGTSLPAWTSNGKYAAALDFDGTNDYVSLGTPTTLDIRDAVTVAAWVQKTGSNAEGWQSITGTTGWGDSYWFSIDYNGAVMVNLENVIAYSTFITANSVISDNQWYHVAFTYDKDGGANNGVIYVNGVPQKYITATGAIGGADGTRYIGMANQAPNLYGFNGVIDEVRIYNRALGGSEIKALYEWAPGPKTYFNFEDNSSNTVVTDVSGNMLSGTIQGSPTSAQWVRGKYGQGYNFIPVNNSRIQINPDSTMEGLAQFTITAWIKTNSFTTQQQLYLETRDNDGTTRITLKIGTDAKLTFGGKHDDSTDQNWVLDNRVLTANTWYHVAAVYDSIGDDHKVFLNGVPTTNQVIVTAIDTGNNNNNLPKIGSSYNGSDNYFNGVIDEYKIYHYARTDAQIIEDMNGGHPVGGSPIGSKVAEWKFDEGYGTTAQDFTTNNLDVTLSSPTWYKDGKSGKAFDGSSGGAWASIVDPASGQLDFAAADDFSISAWFKSSSASNPGDSEFIVSKILDNVTQEKGYAIFVDVNGYLYLGIDDDNTFNPDNYVTDGVDYYDGRWHHVVGVKTGTTSLELYVDGKKVATSAITITGTLENSRSFVIGDANKTNDSYEFTGYIDEVKVYRAALTPEQVKIDYAGGQSLVLGSTSTGVGGTAPDNSSSRAYCVPGDSSTCNAPVGHWNFDEGAGSTVMDISGNGNTGTITGAVFRTGKQGSALQFDGNDDVVDADPSDWSGSFTVSFWAKALSTTQTDFAGVFSSATSNANNTFQIDTGEASSGCAASYRVRIADSTGSADNTCIGSITTNWQYVTVTFDGASTLRVYLDGELTRTKSLPSFTGLFTTYRIGRNRANNATFNGRLDDVRVYNYVRTPAQIAWEYNRGAPVAWYKMNECSGTAIGDWGPNANGGYRGINGSLTLGSNGVTSTGSCTASANTAWYNGRNGKREASLSFDGSDDYVDIGLTSSASGTEGTITAWIKLASNSGGFTILGSADEATTTNYFHFRVSNDKLDLAQRNNDTQDEITGITTLSIGRWYHVAIVSNGSEYTMYVDGKQEPFTIATGSNSGDWFGDTSGRDNMHIGVLERTSLMYYFNGHIDDVKIFNYALTKEQIRTEMNSGAVRFQ